MKKQNSIKEMFQNIRNNLKKEVTCVHYDHGKIIIDRFILRGFKEYEYISTKGEHKYIPFVDFNEYIVAILDDEDNVLYENRVFNKDTFKINNISDLISKQKLLFGEDYVSIEEQNSKEYLTKQGLNELDNKYYNEWIRFVDVNYSYDINIIKAIISYIRKINDGMSFYEAEIKVFSDEFPNIYDKTLALTVINYIYKNNPDYLKYIRSDFCTGGEYKSATKKKKRKFVKSKKI